MIQRIQTIWLSVLAILSVSLMRGGIIQFNNSDGSMLILGFSGISKNTNSVSEVVTGSVGLPLTIVLIPLLAVTAIFLYRKIKLQKKVILLIIAFSISMFIMTIYYWYIISINFDGVIIPGVKMTFPPLIFLLAVFAYRGVIKDERVLKSYDRLR